MKRIKLTMKPLLFILLFIFVSFSDSTETFDNGNTDDTEIFQELDGLNSKDGDKELSSRSIDCSRFNGITTRRNFLGVKTSTILDLDDSSVVWTIDGVEVTPVTLRILRMDDHLSESKVVEVCYSAFSPTCGELKDCITFDYQKK